MKPPKISVIIPAYNAEPYIAQAIESCLQQTVPPDEIVVVDDGSSDRTFEIAQRFPLPVKAIRLPENMGVSVARNRGVEISTGDWLAFLDADDWFLPKKLEMQRLCMNENPNAVLIYTKHRVIRAGRKDQDIPLVAPCELSWRLRYHCAFHLGSVLLRRDAFEASGRFDPAIRTAQDWELWLRVLARYSAGAFAAVPETLVVYRRVAGSLGSSAMRYLTVRPAIIDNRSLFGTTGLSRLLLRRRINAFNFYDTALAVRDGGSSHYLRLVLKSLALWPLPNRLMTMNRYKVAFVMLLQHLGCWPNSLQSEEACLTELSPPRG